MSTFNLFSLIYEIIGNYFVLKELVYLFYVSLQQYQIFHKKCLLTQKRTILLGSSTTQFPFS